MIVNGNLTTTSEESGAPTGGATLGLIAQNFVRVYHPVKKGYTTAHVTPSTEAPTNGKCVNITEPLSARIHGTTEVSEITTTGLTSGSEVEGTVAGQIEAGTVVSKVEAASEKKLILNKTTNPPSKELSATILKSTEVTGVTTTGLTVGDEVEGTAAGQIEAGTVVSEIKAGNKIKLSKAAKPSGTELSAKITSGSTEVTEITTSGLVLGEEVEQTKSGQLESGTVISEIKTGKIKLSKAAKKTETTKLKFYGEEATKLKFYGATTKLKFYVPTGYAYNSNLDTCHKVESGYSEYRESENLYIKSCESESEYTSNAFCEYKNSSKGCAEKATNLNSTEDPNHWGSLENPVIDAAILSTKHSWIVDNYKCGEQLGKLNVWGSIAQFWRGPVGTSGNSGTGYIKNYNYDQRLATQQPPNFLSPSSTSWKLSRETAPPTSFTG